MKYLVDTDWIIDALANVPDAITTLRMFARDGISISIVSYAELYDGAYGSEHPEAEIARIQQFLGSYPVIGLSDAIVDRFGQTRSRLRLQGMLIPDLDLLIGATAIIHNLTVMTRNTRHFGRIPDLVIYRP
ncbi:MAG: type II toxin-antitoxin system VapC family toxin [Thermomicrobiales bacterium]